MVDLDRIGVLKLHPSYRHNLSSSRGSKVPKREMFLVRGTGVTLGLGFGYFVLGGNVSESEELRQNLTRDKVDIREKMWPALRGKMPFRIMSRMWSESGLRNHMSRMRSDFRTYMGMDMHLYFDPRVDQMLYGLRLDQILYDQRKSERNRELIEKVRLDYLMRSTRSDLREKNS